MNRIFKISNLIVGIVFALILSWILLLVCFFGANSDYACKKTFLLSNPVLMLLGIVMIGFAFFFVGKYYKGIEGFLSVYGNKTLWGLLVLFVATQIYACYNYYFITGWDVEYIMQTSEAIAYKEYENIPHQYFSTYPNNVLICYLFSLILRFEALFGITSIETGVFGIIVFQILITAFISYLVYKFVLDYSHSFTLAFSVWLVYILFIGLSPWKIIPYSDSTGLLFPMLVIYIFSTTKNNKKLVLKYALIGLFSFLGYKIKPQAIFTLIAVLIAELLFNFFRKFDKQTCKQLAVKFVSVAMAFVLSSSVFSTFIVPKTQIEIDENISFSMAHLLMMGLNNQTNGVYSSDDFAFSKNYASYEVRKDLNLLKARARLEDMGVVGTAKLFAKKTLTNYNDGTFAWSAEGNFYSKTFEDKNKFFSPFLKNIFYESGKYYNLYSTSLQMVWLLLLIGLIGVFVKGKFNFFEHKEVYAMLLCIIALTFFETLFEARARYFFLYSPVYLICGMLGMINIVAELKGRFNKKKNRTNAP